MTATRHRGTRNGDLAAVASLRPPYITPIVVASTTSEPFSDSCRARRYYSLSRTGNVWDHAAMESFCSSLKTERTAATTYRARDQAKTDVFDYIECFYNPSQRHSTLGDLSPMEFERQAELA